MRIFRLPRQDCHGAHLADNGADYDTCCIRADAFGVIKT